MLISLGAGVQGMRCIAHCLHNAIKKACATPLIESDIKLLRTPCKEIKKSTILSGQLANLARANGKKKCKVVLDCKWRWGYALKMIRMILKWK